MEGWRAERIFLSNSTTYLWGNIFALIVLLSLGQALQHSVLEQKSLILKIDGNCFDCFACIKSPLSLWTTGIATISLV